MLWGRFEKKMKTCVKFHTQKQNPANAAKIERKKKKMAEKKEFDIKYNLVLSLYETTLTRFCFVWNLEQIRGSPCDII